MHVLTWILERIRLRFGKRTKVPACSINGCRGQGTCGDRMFPLCPIHWHLMPDEITEVGGCEKYYRDVLDVGFEKREAEGIVEQYRNEYIHEVYRLNCRSAYTPWN